MRVLVSLPKTAKYKKLPASTAQPQSVVRPTWGIHRGTTGVLPARHRWRGPGVAAAEPGGNTGSAATALAYAIIRSRFASAFICSEPTRKSKGVPGGTPL